MKPHAIIATFVVIAINIAILELLRSYVGTGIVAYLTATIGYFPGMYPPLGIASFVALMWLFLKFDWEV